MWWNSGMEIWVGLMLWTVLSASLRCFFLNSVKSGEPIKIYGHVLELFLRFSNE